MATVYFSHPSDQVGNLTIEDGIDQADWAYNLNTQTFPTYGGEVVQILSVYINDLTLGGSVATYSQREAIYAYFAAYIQIATQGKNPTPQAGTSAYNLQPIVFTYPERNWSFKIFPKSVPGFQYSYDTVMPTWKMVAFILDDSANSALNDIKDAIKMQAISQGIDALKRLNDEISPIQGDPNLDPFQTYDQNAQKTRGALTSIADYYNTLLPYTNSDGSPVGNGASGPAQPAQSNQTQQPSQPKNQTAGQAVGHGSGFGGF